MTAHSRQISVLFERSRRGFRLVRRVLANLPGVRAKWAMCRCIVGHVRGRLGWPGRGGELTLQLEDLRMTVEPHRAEIKPYFEIWYEGSYEMRPGFQATEDGCVVDVGGNVGFYAIRQGRRAVTGRVVVFEPSPGAFGRLRRNVEANEVKNAELINAAVGSSCGTVHFIEEAMSINSRVVANATDVAIDIPCVTLDSALARLGIHTVDILLCCCN